MVIAAMPAVINGEHISVELLHLLICYLPTFPKLLAFYYLFYLIIQIFKLL